MWFNSTLPTDHPPMFEFQDIADTDASNPTPLPPAYPYASIPCAAAVPVCAQDDLSISQTPSTSALLLDAIHFSEDRLFFVSYCPDGTLRPRWYLVQVDLVQSLAASPACTTNGRYYCHFLGCHPDDASLPDPDRRWWLLWHRFTHSHDNVIEYGTHTLFNPITTPDPAAYIAWADVLPLLDPTVCLLGPLSFTDPPSNPPGRTSSFHQMLSFDIWASLLTLCISRGILPPVLANPPSTRSRWTCSSRPAPR